MNPRLKVSEWFDRLILPSGGARFDACDFRQWCGPIVYLFVLKGEALYVGFSRNGIGRPSQPTHRQARKARAACDEVLIWPTGTVADAQRLERLLIAQLNPICNRRFGGAGLVEERLGIRTAKRYKRPLTEKEKLWRDDRSEFIRRYMRAAEA